MMDVSMRRQLVAALAASLTACGGGPDTTALRATRRRFVQHAAAARTRPLAGPGAPAAPAATAARSG